MTNNISITEGDTAEVEGYVFVDFVSGCKKLSLKMPRKMTNDDGEAEYYTKDESFLLDAPGMFEHFANMAPEHVLATLTAIPESDKGKHKYSGWVKAERNGQTYLYHSKPCDYADESSENHCNGIPIYRGALSNLVWGEGPIAVKIDIAGFYDGSIARAWRVEIGAQLAEARRSARMSQAELGKLIGIAQSHVARIERGELNTTVETVGKICSALGYTIKIERPTFGNH